MKSFRHLIILLLTIFNLQILFGQSLYKIENVNFSDGLPSDKVISTISYDGYLYVATQRGMCMYDGYQFIKQNNTNASCISLSVYNNSLYYFTSGEGLSIIKSIFDNPTRLAKVNFNDSTPNNDIYENIFIDSKKRIWCSDHENIKFINSVNNEIKSTRIDFENGLQNHQLKFIEPKNNEIWIASKNGLYVWDNNTNTIKKHEYIFLKNTKLSSATYFNTNQVFFGSSDGMFIVYDLKSNKNIQTEKISKNNIPLHIVDNYFYNNTLLLYDMKR